MTKQQKQNNNPLFANLKTPEQIGLFSERVHELEKMYNHINDCLFVNGAGERISLPVFITIQSKGKRAAYGWCYIIPNWKDKDGKDYAIELNIAAETLDRPIEETFRTMVHEMVHIYNLQKGINDCNTTSQRHNNNFKKGCDLIGLATVKDDRFGWMTRAAQEDNSEEYRACFEEYLTFAKKELLEVHRMDENEVKITIKGLGGKAGKTGVATTKKRGANSLKLTCPCCGASARVTKATVRLMCLDCQLEMEQ